MESHIAKSLLSCILFIQICRKTFLYYKIFKTMQCRNMKRLQVSIKPKNIPGAPDNTTEVFIFSNNKWKSYFNRWNFQSQKYLYQELKIIEDSIPELAKFYIESNMHFDFSPIALLKFVINGRYDLLSLNWFTRSVKFYLWKLLRKTLPTKLTEKIFNLIN